MLVKCNKCGAEIQTDENVVICPDCGEVIVIKQDDDVETNANKDEVICPNCGKINDKDDLVCFNCGTRLKEEVNQQIDNQEYILCSKCGNKNLASDIICSNCGNKLHEDEKKKEKAVKEKSSNVKMIPIIVLLVVVLAVGGFFGYKYLIYIPGQYNKALDAFNNANTLEGYLESYDLLVAMGDYKDSSTQALSCASQISDLYCEDKDFDKAIDWATKSESELAISKANYGKACQLLEEEKFADAAIAFKQLETYEDSEKLFNYSSMRANPYDTEKAKSQAQKYVNKYNSNNYQNIQLGKLIKNEFVDNKEVFTYRAYSEMMQGYGYQPIIEIDVKYIYENGSWEYEKTKAYRVIYTMKNTHGSMNVRDIPDPNWGSKMGSLNKGDVIKVSSIMTKSQAELYVGDGRYMWYEIASGKYSGCFVADAGDYWEITNTKRTAIN